MFDFPPKNLQNAPVYNAIYKLLTVFGEAGFEEIQIATGLDGSTVLATLFRNKRLIERNRVGFINQIWVAKPTEAVREAKLSNRFYWKVATSRDGDKLEYRVTRISAYDDASSFVDDTPLNVARLQNAGMTELTQEALKPYLDAWIWQE